MTTQQELEDDDYQSFESENEIENIDLTSAWNDKKTTVSKPGPIFKLSTGYNRKIRTASKIKSKYLKKKIGQREKSNKISSEWLKTAGYLNTKDQDKINYMFVSPKKETAYNIPSDAGHFLRTEIDSTDFKKENLTSKVRRNKNKKPYLDLKEWQPKVEDETAETIKILDDIAILEPGKNAQIAAKKISEKYKALREANARKNKFKLPGEIVKTEKVKTDQGKVNVPVSIEKPKRSSKKAAKKMIKKYDKIRQEKTFKKIVDANEKRKKNKNIEIIEDIKDSAAKKAQKQLPRKYLKNTKV